MRWTRWRNLLMRLETPCQTPSLLARSGGRGLRIKISQAGDAGGHGIGADRRVDERNAGLCNGGAQIRVEFVAEGRVREANEMACGVTNGLGDCLIGQEIGQLFGANLIDQRPIAAVLRTLQDGASVQGRFEMHPNEAGARIIEGSFTPVIGPEGAVRGILFLGAEVTDMDAGSDARTGDRACHRRHGLGLFRGG
ncbi:PAS domain-containing protein [Sulfitobacter sp. PS-8MA]|uniref:PAS domain-containing protein n=1 Tax=Sulfitobacter sp. PS-8MA TaxID=3237707 RepID=UPI0034C5C91C